MLYAIWFRHSGYRLWSMFTTLPATTPSHLTVIRGNLLPNKLEADMFCKWRTGMRGAYGTEYRAFEEGVDPNEGSAR